MRTNVKHRIWLGVDQALHCPPQDKRRKKNPIGLNDAIEMKAGVYDRQFIREKTEFPIDDATILHHVLVRRIIGDEEDPSSFFRTVLIQTLRRCAM